MRIVLASGSPRRRDLLTWAGFDLDVRPQHIDETWNPAIPPMVHALHLAQEKAASALNNLDEPQVVVAADTVVHIEGRLFDKPVDRSQAAEHLRALSGKEHRVSTGVCVVSADHPADAFVVTTVLRFRVLEDREIAAYLATGEADDKAGAYAIQGVGGAFVADVRGSWTNVMGLPLEETLTALRPFRS